MYPGIHNFSEIGKLNKVLLHRPGKELEALTPATLERLLFDDVPYLKIAQEEHDNFARVLRENGVEVVYYVDEVAKAIGAKINVKGFVRFETGEGIEKKQEDFAAEVAAQRKG